MRSWDLKRASVLVLTAAFATSACSGGFGGGSAAPPSASEAAPSAAASEAAEPVTLTYLVDDTEATQARAKALADAYTALHPNVTFDIETRPGGTDGDNIVKTRLATGEMTDIFWYNSGSLLQALNPTEIARRRLRRAVHRQHRRVVHPDRVAGRRHLRRAERDGDGRRHPVQQEGLRRPGPRGADDLGRVRRQQREDQGRRHRPGRRRPSATPGRPSCSSSPTTSTSRRPSPTSPRSTRSTRPTTRTRLPRWPASSASRRPSTRAGGRRTSPRPSSTTGSKPSPRARPPTIRC